MNSNISNDTGRAAGAALAVICAWLLASIGAAQELTDPSKVIFEPMLLPTAAESPLELMSSSERDRRSLLRSIDRQLAAIEPLRDNGSSSPELVELLGLLAVAYQDLERHEEALATLDEAVALTVKSGGRSNLEQIPLLEQKIPSYLALDDVASIDDTEERIYSIYDAGFEPSDRQMYYATMNLADWNTAAYFRENFGVRKETARSQRLVMNRVQRCISIPGTGAGQGSSGCLQDPIFTGDIKDVFDQDINDARLRKVDRLYAGYQAAIVARGNVQLDIILDISRRIARLAFITKQEMDFERENYAFDPNYEGSREQAARNSPARMDESYDSGLAALKYAIDLPNSVATFRPEALAAALLDVGDWHLVYGKMAAAEDAYEQAYRVLLDAGFSSQNIDRALATDMPVRVPVFATHLHTRQSVGLSADAALDLRGYVDLAFVVDGLGNARGVEFLGRSSPDSAGIERLIERQLRSAKFRPTLRGSELISPGRIEARYYYAY